MTVRDGFEIPGSSHHTQRPIVYRRLKLGHRFRLELFAGGETEAARAGYMALPASSGPSGTVAYDLYFTGSRGNPRQCIILGEDVEPICYRFETPEVFMTNKRTTIYRNQDELVAVFDWTADSYLGLCTVKNRQPFPMAMFVLPGSSLLARAFFLNGTKFEWRRTRQDQFNYDLYHTPQNGPSVRIAFFRTVDQATPLGPAHGFLQYNFIQPALLLEALLALNINRWMDLNAM